MTSYYNPNIDYSAFIAQPPSSIIHQPNRIDTYLNTVILYQINRFEQTNDIIQLKNIVTNILDPLISILKSVNSKQINVKNEMKYEPIIIYKNQKYIIKDQEYTTINKGERDYYIESIKNIYERLQELYTIKKNANKFSREKYILMLSKRGIHNFQNIVGPEYIDERLENSLEQIAGTLKQTYVPIDQKHRCADGVSRRVYQKGSAYYVARMIHDADGKKRKRFYKVSIKPASGPSAV